MAAPPQPRSGPLALIHPCAAASLRADAAVSAPSEALQELVCNAVDAAATEVQVELNLAGWDILVRDNGHGISISNLRRLGRHSNVPQRTSQLGYRGEALAALSVAAQEVEVVSRAMGSFETDRVLLRGGQVVEQGLALDQCRQGTQITIRGLFYNQPVRRKALITAGLQRELERCKQMLVQLALLRSSITFTCFDLGRQAFLLRLFKGRPEQQMVGEFLGHPLEHIAGVRPAPDAMHAVSGYAVLPPLGHCNASRQLVLLNGRCVKAPAISRLVTALFQQLYKPNMRLQNLQGEMLQQVHHAANRHAAFVLQISCIPDEFELARDADGHIAHFASWDPVLMAVRHALMAAWRLALSDTLLKELEELERCEAAGVAPAQTAAAVQDQECPSLPAERKSTNSRGSGRSQAKGSGRQLAGSKRALGSGLVCYTSDPANVASQAVTGVRSPTSVPQGQPSRNRAYSGASMAPQQGSLGTLMRDDQRSTQPGTQQLMVNWQADGDSRTLAGSWSNNFLDGRQADSCQPTNVRYLGTSGFDKNGAEPVDGILSLDSLASTVLAQLQPSALLRADLAAGKALHQVQRSYIPVMCGSLLALVDQHAADERVQLELLRDHLLGPGGQPRDVPSQALRAPLTLTLTDGELQLLEDFKHKVAAWGWKWQQQASSRDPAQSSVPHLTHVPLLWSSTMSATDLKLYLHQLQETCGSCGLPAAVVRVLNSKACRGAIMFNDRLSQAECQEVLDRLKRTQLCFSCAHGRPTMVPIVDLQRLKQVLLTCEQTRQQPCGGGGCGIVAPGSQLMHLKNKLQRLLVH